MSTEIIVLATLPITSTILTMVLLYLARSDAANNK
jgi:hypothetical protein